MIKKGIGNFFRGLLSIAVVISSPAISLAGQTAQKTKQIEHKKISTRKMLTEYRDSYYRANPLVEAALDPKDPQTAVPKELLPEWDLNNPLLDKNPYFMREQKWTALSAGELNEKDQNKAYQFRAIENGTQVSFKGINYALTLPIALEPILDSSEYLIFTARKNSKIFVDKLDGDTKSSGEGLFYIAKQDLLQKSKWVRQGIKGSALAVPVYYFALSDKGWMGAIEAFEWDDLGQIITFNGNDGIPLPIDVDDLVDHHKHAQLNLAFAKAISLFIDRGQMTKGTDIVSPYPARGATAAFGTFLTGVTLDDPNFSFAKVSSVGWSNHIKNIANLIMPKAHADVSLIDPATMERLWFVGKLVGGGFLVSMALKYSKYREYFKEKYQPENVEPISPEERKKGIKGVAQKVAYAWKKTSKSVVGREFKGVMDVYAHTLTTMVKFIPLNIINVLEYAGDRYAYKVVSSDNSIIRKTFLETYGWARGTMKNLAVNYKTWFLGSVVMGTVDTLLVVLQLLIVTPMVQEKLVGLGWVDPSTLATVGLATAIFVTAEIIRNITGYFNHGAFSYSHEQKIIVQDKIHHEVDKEMNRLGLDPKDKTNQNEREKRIAERMDQAMKLRGLPGKDEFLFDAMSIFKKIVNSTGFSVEPLGAGKEISEKALFQEGRWGLAKPALKQAIRAAKKMNKEYGSRVGLETLKLLETLNDRLSYLKAAVKMTASPVTHKNYLKEAKQVRQVLTLLSFGGDVTEVIKHLPNWFTDLTYSEEAVIAAARLYHSSLFGIVEGDKDAVIVSSKSRERVRTYLGEVSPEHARNKERLDRLEGLEKKFAEAEEAQADKQSPKSFRAEFVENNPLLVVSNGKEKREKDSAEKIEDEAIRNRPQPNLVSKVGQAYDEAGEDLFLRDQAHNRTYKMVDDTIDHKTEVDTYVPKKGGWYKRWQKSRAHRLAKIELLEKSAADEEIVNVDKEAYRQAYTKHLSKKVGLHPQFGSVAMKTIVKEAEEAAEEQLQRPQEVSYMETLSEVDRMKFEMDVYMDHFFTSYRMNTVESDETVEDAFSSENPGFFQRVRTFIIDERPVEGTGFWKSIKRKVVNTTGAKIVNKVLRTTEALWSTGAYDIGFLSLLERRMPLFHDGWRNIWREMKLMPHLITFAYLVQYYVWQVKYDYFLWVFFIALGFSGTMAMELNNRLMQNWGIKPMEGVWSKIKYSFLHSWLTYPTLVPVFIYAESIQKFSDNFVADVVDPTLAKGGQYIDAGIVKLNEAGQAIGSLCSSILGN